ncbi:hypothetical protein BHE74_00007798 [Ensete ventricosum]|nr:hypothetical protein GW17_00017779 [Ensete ventricosum]RWW83695.1 hypothetical protein BHE74_00007798 [Ensete ventricosum]
MLDKSSIVRCHGHCSLVGCCVCPDMSFIVICHGSRGIVRRSTAASALIRRLLPADMGQGHWSRVGLAHWLYCVVRCQRGYLHSLSEMPTVGLLETSSTDQEGLSQVVVASEFLPLGAHSPYRQTCHEL